MLDTKFCLHRERNIIQMRQSISSTTTSATHCNPFYINITLLNKDEVVAEKVAERAGKGFLGKAAAFAANKLVTEEKVVQKFSELLVDRVEKAVAEVGIEASVEIKYKQGPLVVVQMQVTEVDPLQLVLSAKGAEFASSFSTLLTAAENIGLKDKLYPQILERITSKVNEALMEKFEEMIPKKFAEQNIIVSCQSCSLSEEAEFLFAVLPQK